MLIKYIDMKMYLLFSSRIKKKQIKNTSSGIEIFIHRLSTVQVMQILLQFDRILISILIELLNVDWWRWFALGDLSILVLPFACNRYYARCLLLFPSTCVPTMRLRPSDGLSPYGRSHEQRLATRAWHLKGEWMLEKWVCSYMNLVDWICIG